MCRQCDLQGLKAMSESHSTLGMREESDDVKSKVSTRRNATAIRLGYLARRLASVLCFPKQPLTTSANCLPNLL